MMEQGGGVGGGTPTTKGGGVLPGFSGINGYLYASQKARIRPPTRKELEGPNNKDKAADDGDMKENSNDNDEEEEEEVPPPTQPGGTVLECLGPIKSRSAAACVMVIS